MGTTKSFFVLILVLAPFFVMGNPQIDPPDGVATVHVYRPQNIIGFAWVFNLKVNGEKYGKIKNGRHLILSFTPGKTVFSVKKKEVELNLEAGKTYYLRSFIEAGYIIGSLDLVEVTESFARQELKLE